MLGVRVRQGVRMISNRTSVRRAPQSRWLVASLLGTVFGVLFELALTAPASANILITIDKSNQQMSVEINGARRYLWPVSTGRAGYDTPSGMFKPNRMDADHFSQEWDNAPMPHAIFFDLDGHAIHGFFDVKHLGSAVSHGCVRLSPDHAQTLFNLIKAEGMSETTPRWRVRICPPTRRLTVGLTMASRISASRIPASRIPASRTMGNHILASRATPGPIPASLITANRITRSRAMRRQAMRRRPLRLQATRQQAIGSVEDCKRRMASSE